MRVSTLRPVRPRQRAAGGDRRPVRRTAEAAADYGRALGFSGSYVAQIAPPCAPTRTSISPAWHSLSSL